MANDRLPPIEIFHVLGQGWYVAFSSEVKGPFPLRSHAEDYAAALQRASEKGELSDAGPQPSDEPPVVQHPGYVGPDRRVRHRRSIDDRRSRIRFDSLKKPRRSERERREPSSKEGGITFNLFGI